MDIPVIQDIRTVQLPRHLTPAKFYEMYKDSPLTPDQIARELGCLRQTVECTLKWQKEKADKKIALLKSSNTGHLAHVSLLLRRLMGSHSIRQFAEHTGIQHMRLHRVLKGANDISLGDAIALSKRYNLQITDFIPPEDRPQTTHLTNNIQFV